MNASAAETPAAGALRTLRYAALLATYLQSVNVSIPNAVLRFIQASTSMTDDQAGWIFTSYLAATAISMPVAQWLAARFGVKTVYQAALVLFAVGLWLATLTTTPLEFMAARIVQGIAAGLIAPLSLGIALETVPAAQRPKFGVPYGAAVLLGIVSGPAIGGLIAEYHGWHMMFYASMPIAALIFFIAQSAMERRKAAALPVFDFFGYASFTVGVIALQMLLDRGERMEWFESREIWIEAMASALGFYLFFAHRWTANAHFLGKHLFKDRNFVLSTIMFFAFGFVLLPTLALTSPMLDEILGYPPITTGYLTIPRGVGLVGTFLLMSKLPARIDSRLMIAIGMLIVIYANWLMLGYSPLMDWTPVAIAGFVQGVGMGILMPAISKAAFSTLDPKFRPEGTGLFNLSRVYGSTLGIAIVQTYFYNNTQAMHQALASHLTPYRSAVHSLTASTPAQAFGALNEMITGQAAFIAVVDQFKILMLAMVVVIPLVAFLRKPVATN
ncbi:MAG: DHA2 family efflux MFS transporter permease subunit [Pseudomonas sp.]|uniref:DHA2 family efflux MFS transporter permease subunit n=1 Tax=Pseudomonas sp. TaxID=306 RepID=UPI00239AC58B|nr:DHA2 family efflux MFS transporter permease subunit [Pseudomonas sp.]MDE1194837.1 DHA2 family efflux MFS transporter permease subunit [Pseudomonas sp.]